MVYERLYALSGQPVLSHGNVEASPLLPTAGEVFDLRKLLPQTGDYDFNVHVMDFKPGEFLFVKVGQEEGGREGGGVPGKYLASIPLILVLMFCFDVLRRCITTNTDYCW